MPRAGGSVDHSRTCGQNRFQRSLSVQGRPAPAIWQPPAGHFRCQYFTDWVAINTRWKLAIDPAE